MKKVWSVFVSILAFMICSCLVMIACSAPKATSTNHRPASFPEMERLVTPKDPIVIEALSQSLNSPLKTLNQTDASSEFDHLREWVYQAVESVSDETAHGVEDYWQTPAETLALKTGDCEDYAILLVSMLRAFGVPSDQVYVAVSYDWNDKWHANVVERYCYGAWRQFDVDNLGLPWMIDSASQVFTIDYCFNDRQGFMGKPGYPAGYVVPAVTYTPVVGVIGYDHVFLACAAITGGYKGDAFLTKPSMEDIKQRMGKLWLPRYLPNGYTMVSSTVQFNWTAILTYHVAWSSALLVIKEKTESVSQYFPAGAVEKVSVNNHPAYIVYGAWGDMGEWKDDVTMLLFNLDGRAIWIEGTGGKAAWSTPELIKIAESLTEY